MLLSLSSSIMPRYEAYLGRVDLRGPFEGSRVLGKLQVALKIHRQHKGKQNRCWCTYQRAVECGGVHADGRVRVLLTGGVGGAVHGARSPEPRADSWVGPECQAVVLA